MKKQVYIIQVNEGLSSSLLQKMSSPQNMMLTDNIVKSKIFESYENAMDFIEGLKKTYSNNKYLSFNTVDAFLEVIL